MNGIGDVATCNLCLTLEKLERLDKKILRVKKYLASGDYRGDLKPFNDWKGRKKVDISFRDSFSGNKDRFKNNDVPDETYICLLPKKTFPAFPSEKLVILVGKDMYGWWERHGSLDAENTREGCTYKLIMAGIDDICHKEEQSFLRRDEALAQGIIEISDIRL